MNPGAPPREVYVSRLAERNRTLAALTRRRDNVGTLRLFVFLAAAAVVWFAIKSHLSPWWIAAPAALFIVLVVWQSRAERDMERAKRAIRFCEHGMARLDGRWQGKLGGNGERFLDPHHPYAIDLDLFGRASLFELLSTARTAGGETRLAAWLTAAGAVSIEEMLARQAAIDELRPMLDLREQLAVLGDDYSSGVDPAKLAEWANAVPRVFPGALRLAACILSAITTLVLLFWIGSANPDARLALIALGLIEALIGVPVRARVLAIVSAVGEPARDLGLLAQILATLETQQFHSPRLAALRASIDVSGRPASERIATLRRLMDMLDSRENPIVRAIGPLALWTTQVAMAIEAWRAENGPYVAGWLDAIGEIEALSSLASYAWEHPADPFPEFAEGGPGSVFEGEDLGHPLLAEDACVRNSVAMAPPLRLLIVSGSNMSGKSTLLRTIGINTVLALAGAPVRAKRLTLSRMSLGASIHTVDSLEEGHSRFMAEILRLKQVLDLATPALFLLDELLGGTNSHDRSVGSEGLVRALLDRGAIGLVTTHDLSLAKVADDLAPAGANVHFEDRLENGQLIFDYKMRPGIVTRSNALDLMRAVGLDV